MPRTCTICNHPERAAIESALVLGTSYRDIALQFGIGHMAVQRHASEHVQEAVKQSQEATEEARGLDVVKQLKNINDITLAILKESRDAKKNGMALFAIDRVIKQIELQAKLLGDIDTPQINIMVTPEWIRIRTTLVQALAPFPDAKISVAAALVRMENEYASLN